MGLNEDLERVALQERELQLTHMDEQFAWELGSHIRTIAKERGFSIVIDVRRFGKPLFIRPSKELLQTMFRGCTGRKVEGGDRCLSRGLIALAALAWCRGRCLLAFTGFSEPDSGTCDGKGMVRAGRGPVSGVLCGHYGAMVGVVHSQAMPVILNRLDDWEPG